MAFSCLPSPATNPIARPSYYLKAEAAARNESGCDVTKPVANLVCWLVLRPCDGGGSIKKLTQEIPKCFDEA